MQNCYIEISKTRATPTLQAASASWPWGRPGDSTGTRIAFAYQGVVLGSKDSQDSLISSAGLAALMIKGADHGTAELLLNAGEFPSPCQKSSNPAYD
jgi:hypothetical protein